MARRPYGSGCLLKVKGGYAIRWRERQMLPDGSTKRMLRYKTLGDVSKKEANRILNEKMITGHVLRPTATFQELVSSWEDSVLPLYNTQLEYLTSGSWKSISCHDSATIRFET